MPIVAEYFDDLDLYLYWLSYFHPVLYFGQVFKVASAFSLVVASFERFFITRHWTFSGFQYRTRLFIFVVIVLLATLSKMPTYTVSNSSIQHLCFFLANLAGSMETITAVQKCGTT